ncbi:AP endonuclease [Clostridium pasteurianum DSM 525 = ATCC 6013]|uniref:AP endonuclease n=1 Tax=Clostridium pasteurianum DSM 525 = ATCC 6013 TaxID=1262449 RepID=A0A0H3J6D9_CLOPA|nr:sugar phosphate isomerase/epimerase [Clostridium pasteurianum]AJA48747.1 AP endonuclease [Clostridium pasteurianum DSM 525 = ATCC 6013]AJA52735.1 AP endonuclease [Clostridium pasteurianum DSM 525 = ATCC 6013]AOZ75970.1 AP endonuclease [Clostridium pasteurianum DSM 525 = ATCC 6013]AOZ79766.1 AP endonuclease [Clostridium pasteurianum]ELP60046.1 AP endonuclease [Clostridium pasteurianum DSM 525 = ATCC 6013]
MEIGLSSAVFYPNIKTEDSIKLISDLGFTCAEVFLNSPFEYENDFIKKLTYIKESCGLKINSVHSFSSSFEPYLFDAYKRRRRDMLKFFEMVCKAGSSLGASCYTFHGMRNGPTDFISKDLIHDVYNNLTYIAGENDIKLAQENVSWCMSSNLEYLQDLKDNCRYPLYFTLDIKQAYRAGVNPLEYLNIMDKDLINFHINDRNDIYSCLLPGDGDVDFQSIFSKIKSLNYKGNAIMEVYSNNYTSYEDIKKSKRYLEKFV